MIDVTKAPRDNMRDDFRPANGVECPRCGCCDTSVYYTRKKPGRIVRRRECRHCAKRFTTRET